jgi:hypothetical protein
MAESSPDKPDLKTHPMVSKLVGDSDTPPSLVALAGFFGPSRKSDCIRLYNDLGFQSYFEIPKASIVATTPTDATDDQSPTLVHVKAGTPVDAVQTSTQPVESYLQGGITSAFQPQGGSTGSQAVVQPTPTAIPTNQPACQIHPTPTAIPTNQAACQIHPTPTAIPTNQVACQVHPTPTAVPTNQVACQIHPTPTAIPTHQVFCHPTQQVVCQPHVTQAACGVADLRESAQGIFVPTGPGPCTHSPACFLTNRPRGGNAC